MGFEDFPIVSTISLTANVIHDFIICRAVKILRKSPILIRVFAIEYGMQIAQSLPLS